MDPSGKSKGPPPAVKKVLSLFGSGREEDRMTGYLSFLKIGPKLLRFLPGTAALLHTPLCVDHAVMRVSACMRMHAYPALSSSSPAWSPARMYSVAGRRQKSICVHVHARCVWLTFCCATCIAMCVRKLASGKGCAMSCCRQEGAGSAQLAHHLRLLEPGGAGQHHHHDAVPGRQLFLPRRPQTHCPN